jgi:hypothetical protein
MGLLDVSADIGTYNDTDSSQPVIQTKDFLQRADPRLWKASIKCDFLAKFKTADKKPLNDTLPDAYKIVGRMLPVNADEYQRGIRPFRARQYHRVYNPVTQQTEALPCLNMKYGYYQEDPKYPEYKGIKGNKRCPLCSLGFAVNKGEISPDTHPKIKNPNRDFEKRSLLPITDFLVNVFIRQDYTKPENNGQVRVWTHSKDVHRMLMAPITGDWSFATGPNFAQASKDAFLPYHFVAGHDFTYDMFLDTKGSPGHLVVYNTQPTAFTEQDAMTLLSMAHNLQQFVEITDEDELRIDGYLDAVDYARNPSASVAMHLGSTGIQTNQAAVNNAQAAFGAPLSQPAPQVIQQPVPQQIVQPVPQVAPAQPYAAPQVVSAVPGVGAPVGAPVTPAPAYIAPQPVPQSAPVVAPVMAQPAPVQMPPMQAVPQAVEDDDEMPF